ncbi:tetraacyldisaccharide 4'-kinase [Pelomonas sp. KK5]|uniref:tetraacyldisaccharide 4'-kinase n=1 Tax=Pelomonas sp. KK5 TaxID=1855730 RepID=UPI00097BA9D4|nr:tetraacyldisaccharide 4'-kinase [Pelomonas sp. KK5]
MALAQRLQREWISGGPLSLLLLPVAAVYGALLRLRRLFYRLGWLKTEVLPVPVVVVGNWIVGGAGKTPTTLALLALLKTRGIRAGVISRGYGRADEAAVREVTPRSSAAEAGDEPLLIRLRGGVPVAVGCDRVAAARALLATHPDLQLLLSDDGLQHWRLPRALSILVFDERGIGNGRLLPAGPLREPARTRLGPQELVLYNAAAPSTALPGALAGRRLSGAVELGDWWRGGPARLDQLHALRGRPLIATAGMAQPQRFFDMLRAEGLTTIEPLPLPDHHDFATLPWPPGTPDVLLTEKDAVKVDPARCGTTRVWVVTLDFHPEPEFERALDGHLARLLLPAA